MRNPFPFHRYMQTPGRFSPLAILQFLYHLPKMIRLCYRLMDDPRVPAYLKLICWAAIAYLFFPFDLVPDLMRYFVPGLIDDGFFLFMAFRYLIQHAPPEIVREHVQALSGKRTESES